MVDKDSKITLTLWNNAGTIWNNSDFLRVRRLRIIGSFIGSLPNIPRQVKEHGLPLLLSKNETKLLIEKEFAVLCECPNFVKAPSESVREVALNKRSLNFEKQVAVLKLTRKSEIQEKASTIIKGKLAKRMRLNPGVLFDEEEEAKKIIEEELMKIPDPGPNHLLVQIPTEDPWVCPDDWTEAVWNYPSNDLERIEYSCFRYLWEIGWTVTGGGKFGANLAAYEGDVLQCHAQLLIFCVTYEQELSAKTLVSYARLAHSVKKMAVLAYFNSGGSISFQSLDWAE